MGHNIVNRDLEKTYSTYSIEGVNLITCVLYSNVCRVCTTGVLKYSYLRKTLCVQIQRISKNFFEMSLPSQPFMNDIIYHSSTMGIDIILKSDLLPYRDYSIDVSK